MQLPRHIARERWSRRAARGCCARQRAADFRHPLPRRLALFLSCSARTPPSASVRRPSTGARSPRPPRTSSSSPLRRAATRATTPASRCGSGTTRAAPPSARGAAWTTSFSSHTCTNRRSWTCWCVFRAAAAAGWAGKSVAARRMRDGEEAALKRSGWDIHFPPFDSGPHELSRDWENASHLGCSGSAPLLLAGVRRRRSRRQRKNVAYFAVASQSYKQWAGALCGSGAVRFVICSAMQNGVLSRLSSGLTNGNASHLQSECASSPRHAIRLRHTMAILVALPPLSCPGLIDASPFVLSAPSDFV